MEEEEIRVNWRAAIVPQDGGQAIYGRLSRLKRRQAVVGAEHSLPPGYRCNLALMLPKDRPDAPNLFVEGRGVVAGAVLSSKQFLITVDLLEFKGDGEAILEDRISLYGQVWGRPR